MRNDDYKQDSVYPYNMPPQHPRRILILRSHALVHSSLTFDQQQPLMTQPIMILLADNPQSLREEDAKEKGNINEGLSIQNILQHYIHAFYD